MSGVLAYSFLLPVIITIIGWFVVARQAEKRELRKEIRDRIHELKVCVADVQAATSEYWLKANKPDRPVAAIQLKSTLKRLALHVSIIQRAGLSFNGTQLVVEIRKYATGGQFEQTRRKRVPKADAERVATTSSLAEDLMQQAELAFYDCYAPPIRDRRWISFVPLLGLMGMQSDTE